MKLSTFGKAPRIALLLAILVVSMISIALGSQSSETAFQGYGTIVYGLQVDVNVDTTEVIGANNLSLGFMLYHEWQTWRDNPDVRHFAEDAKFRMVRLFSTEIEPCTSWDESTKTGTFSWTNLDIIVESIFALSAEPLICIGRADDIEDNLPAGMVLNSTTGLPNPESWAAYCAEWAKHFKQTGKPVRFYEIVNEPWLYFGWNDYAKIANFMALFNAAAQAMRTENPAVRLGFDGTIRKPVLDYWLDNGGADLGFISFHKYDSSEIGRYSDEEMFVRAESYKLATSSGLYGIADARQTYYNARGKLIPVINSESNFNCAWKDGTDPKIQQMVGAVWTALVLRSGVLKGLDYNIYNRYYSSASWERQHKSSGGAGLGMINSDDNQPWYPYYVQWMLGNSMSVDDSIVESVSSSDEIRVLSWIHDEKLNVFLVCKVEQPRTILLHGISSELNITKIDNSISWETPSIQTGLVDPADPLIVDGYTVMLLQSL